MTDESFRVVPAADAFCRPSNQTGVLKLHVQPRAVRQIFNDTDVDALWLVHGTPNEAANTLEMIPEMLADLYPDGPRALPPELGS